MTQNTACSLIAAAVIAAGFLLGWCAGADQPAPAQAPGSPAAGIRGHATAGARDSRAGASGQSTTVRERTEHPAFTR
ncbi:MAG: hypothetical protein IPO58_10525 [Betaproteobacteria bacterium]|nr:hypothetical protein [Betaproteobacteria bacterium]